MITYKQQWDIIGKEMANALDTLQIVAPNTGYILSYDSYGPDSCFIIMDPYGKQLKKYKSFEKALNYLYENN
jgi:hypothetical protein